MSANDILGLFIGLAFLIMGTYFNYKFTHLDKDTKGCK